MTQTLSPGERTGSVQIPASKSQAHRLLICAALSKTESVLRLNGFNEDIEATMQCLHALGARFQHVPEGLHITPVRVCPTEAVLDVGESGSTLRFLLPLLGALGVSAELRLHGRLPQRPLSPLKEVLEENGMQLRLVQSTLYVSGRLCPGTYVLPGNVSSQFISGLLFALPLLAQDSTLRVTGTLQSAQYVTMTAQALQSAGIRLSCLEQVWHIPGKQHYAAPAVQTVEGDWSSAAFFLCMGALSHEGIRVSGLSLASEQADRAILDLLSRFGAAVTCSKTGVTVRRDKLRAITVDAGPIPDLIPVVSVLAAFCEGETVITNAARLRLKESDRLKTTAGLLRALGGLVQEEDAGLRITGQPRLRGGCIDPCGDHRIAMSAAAAACGCLAPVTVLQAGCVAKSYPAFWEDFSSLKEETI